MNRWTATTKGIVVLVLVVTALALAGWAAYDFSVDFGVRHIDQNMREHAPFPANLPTIAVRR
jgi:hypothetical protein